MHPRRHHIAITSPPRSAREQPPTDALTPYPPRCYRHHPPHRRRSHTHRQFDHSSSSSSSSSQSQGVIPTGPFVQCPRPRSRSRCRPLVTTTTTTTTDVASPPSHQQPAESQLGVSCLALAAINEIVAALCFFAQDDGVLIMEMDAFGLSQYRVVTHGRSR
ncbi:hypothetical protein BGZ61DRAFT_240231 [Ilyonectria robusta]|uniref:uncharacterized protein n=1 Tax=Ilyonectria robusta TaxID=1079257 RepID=UPI001E8E80E6|nr:uncharacterized protein BGZ61DRAFT_240231 [Ilyonectria robusta]KAH8699943.1 hypothetical protein BGZ61DRAFT_240231 [Ilyonectria robusta]